MNVKRKLILVLAAIALGLSPSVYAGNHGGGGGHGGGDAHFSGGGHAVVHTGGFHFNAGHFNAGHTVIHTGGNHVIVAGHSGDGRFVHNGHNSFVLGGRGGRWVGGVWYEPGVIINGDGGDGPVYGDDGPDYSDDSDAVIGNDTVAANSKTWLRLDITKVQWMV